MTTINLTRLMGAPALAVALMLATALPASAQNPSPGTDLAGERVYLLANSWLRYGPSLFSRVYSKNTLALELTGRGPCTAFACPVRHNGVDLFARRSKLSLNVPRNPVAFDRVLRVGDEGPDVQLVQQALIRRGYTVDTDGYFGRDTEEAVKAFQHDNGLDADGTVGDYTRDRLRV